MIRLPEEALHIIREHGRRSFPEEACGALYGDLSATGTARIKRVRVARPQPNGRVGDRRRRFRIGPADYRRAEEAAARNGWTLLGFYHSHPDGQAFPSRYDLRHAFPFFSYVILSVREREPQELRSFVMTEDRKRFLEEPIELL